MEGGMDAWEMGGFPLTSLPTISVHQLKDRLGKNGGGLTVLDVRTDREWKDGHVEGALHIHGGKLQERFADVPREKPVAVLCGSGYRSSIAASFLLREGYSDVSNVAGGMAAWRAAQYSQVHE
jgi:hydroxyacylglutathione hydrolase